MKFKTDPESVRCMWKHHFPDIELTETKWFEKYEPHLLMEAMQTAAENREKGKQFDVVDEENVGRYVIGIIRNLKSGQVVKETGSGARIKAEVYYSADYKITENDKARLKTSTDDCGDLIIRGRQGQLYIYTEYLLGVMFMPGEHRPRLWGNFKRSALAVGMKLIQNGDSEGCLAFDPGNKEQVKLAFKIAKVRRRKELSPERKAELTGYLAKARNSRSNPSVEGQLGG